MSNPGISANATLYRFLTGQEPSYILSATSKKYLYGQIGHAHPDFGPASDYYRWLVADSFSPNPLSKIHLDKTQLSGTQTLSNCSLIVSFENGRLYWFQAESYVYLVDEKTKQNLNHKSANFIFLIERVANTPDEVTIKSTANNYYIKIDPNDRTLGFNTVNPRDAARFTITSSVEADLQTQQAQENQELDRATLSSSLGDSEQLFRSEGPASIQNLLIHNLSQPVKRPQDLLRDQFFPPYVTRPQPLTIHELQNLKNSWARDGSTLPEVFWNSFDQTLKLYSRQNPGINLFLTIKSSYFAYQRPFMPEVFLGKHESEIRTTIRKVSTLNKSFNIAGSASIAFRKFAGSLSGGYEQSSETLNESETETLSRQVHEAYGTVAFWIPAVNYQVFINGGMMADILASIDGFKYTDIDTTKHWLIAEGWYYFPSALYTYADDTLQELAPSETINLNINLNNRLGGFPDINPNETDTNSTYNSMSSNPNSNFYNPNSNFYNPNSNFYNPNSNFYNPNSNFSNPNSNFSNPNSNFSNPNSNFSNPNSNFSNPNSNVYNTYPPNQYKSNISRNARVSKLIK